MGERAGGARWGERGRGRRRRLRPFVFENLGLPSAAWLRSGGITRALAGDDDEEELA